MMAGQTLCHYEVLGVQRDVSGAELKKAYRKLALKWHPDKNPDNTEECTKRFATIQTAFDVLGDPQERAWYDKHREAILKGYGEEYEGDTINLMKYFSASSYSGFGDDAKGFYTVYTEVFVEIMEEDLRFMTDIREDETAIPKFGSSDDSYEEVVHPFYAHWQSYSTSRSFVWLETYNTRDALNRRMARLMEKDNKKLRDAAKKEWNEEVRALVSFVRKRDKRVQAYRKRLEEKNAERARLDAEKRNKEQIEREKQFQEYAKQGAEVYAKMEDDLRQVEADLQEEFGDTASSDSDLDENSADDVSLDALFCVACNKDFKSDKAFANHENSKKHREKVAFLKEQMVEDEEIADGRHDSSDDIKDGHDDSDIPDDEEEGEVGSRAQEKSDSRKIKLSKKQKKKRKQQQSSEGLQPVNQTFHDEILDDLPSHVADRLKMSSPDENREEDGASAMSKDEAAPTEDACQERLNGFVIEGEEEEKKPGTRLKGKKAKEARRAAREKTATDEHKTQVGPASETLLLCHVCRNEFPTRNKLFNHIKSTGHALRVTTTERGRRTIETDERNSGKNKLKGRKK